MDAEIKKLENKTKQVCLINKLRVARQDTNNQNLALEDCHQGFVTLLPWL